MEKEAIQLIIDTQRKFFASGKTLDIKYRIAVLKKLRSLIILYEKDILDALYNDFHKPEFEAIATETKFALKELNHAMSKLQRWSKPRRTYTPVIHFISRSVVIPQPYGQILVCLLYTSPSPRDRTRSRM